MKLARHLVTATISLLALAAQAEIDGNELIEGYGLSENEIAQLERGDVLTFSDEDYEFSKRELSADAMAYVEVRHQDVLEAVQQDATLIPVKLLKSYTRINDESDFSDVAFTAEEYGEVEKLFDDSIEKDFNLSATEQAFIRKELSPHQAGTEAEKIAAASDAMRAVLVGRYDAYRARGISAIEGYQRSGRKTVDVGAELQLTNDAAKAFEEDFPEFVRAMSAYPEGGECCEHEFRWLKVRIRKRIAFALAHTMIQTTDEFAVITERYYFVSNTLNSVQLTVLWLPYGEEGGSIGLAMSASADILDSMMGRMLRPVGRTLAKDMVTDAMEDVKADLEGGSPDESPRQ